MRHVAHVFRKSRSAHLVRDICLMCCWKQRCDRAPLTKTLINSTYPVEALLRYKPIEEGEKAWSSYR